MKEEIGWLLERQQGSEGETYTIYIKGVKFGALECTVDSEEALRFCRKRDAEVGLEVFPSKDFTAVEHMWMSDER